MAKRRMFSLDIVDTDNFLDMPATTQALYFQLGMRADDDGFVSSPKKITRLINCSNDDLKLLMAKGYLIEFDNGVMVITDWRVNNWVRPDRKQVTRFTKELQMLSLQDDVYTLQPSDNQVTTERHTEDRLGKDRLGKDRLEDNEISQCDAEKEYIHTSEVAPVQLQSIVDMFNEICTSYPKVTKLSAARQKAIKARLKVYSIEDFREMFTMAEQSHFLKGGNNRNWSANFDWLIKDANMAKVLDGNYNDNTNRSTYQTESESQEDPQKDFEEYLKRYGLDKQEPIDWGDVDVPFK